MSIYSGKCDIADIREIRGDSWDFSKTKIFIGDNLIPLRIDCEKDLVPYYPYLEAYGCGDKDGVCIHLSSKSYVDMEEEDRLNYCLQSFVRYWKKCKRNKVKFDIEECLKKNCFIESEAYRKLAERVQELGDKATIDGLHLPFFDMSRKYLYDEMLRVGYDERDAYRWCFGWDRMFKKES